MGFITKIKRGKALMAALENLVGTLNKGRNFSEAYYGYISLLDGVEKPLSLSARQIISNAKVVLDPQINPNRRADAYGELRYIWDNLKMQYANYLPKKD